MPIKRLNQRKFRFGRGEFWAFLAAISYSCYNVGISWSLSNSNPLVGATLKILPLIVISFFALLINKEIHKLNPCRENFLGIKVIGLLILLGFSYYIAGNLLLFASFQTGGVVLAAPIIGTQVLWTAILASFFLKEELNSTLLTGIIIAILGIVVLSVSKSNGSVIVINIYSVLYGLGAAICYSIGNLLQRYLMNNKKVNHWIVIFMSLFSAEILLNIIYYKENHNIIFVSEQLVTIEKFLFAGIIGASAIFCITKAISLTNVANAVTINSANIALSPLLAFILLGEQLKLFSLFGIIIIFSGIIIVQHKKRINTKEREKISNNYIGV